MHRSPEDMKQHQNMATSDHGTGKIRINENEMSVILIPSGEAFKDRQDERNR